MFVSTATLTAELRLATRRPVWRKRTPALATPKLNVSQSHTYQLIIYILSLFTTASVRKVRCHKKYLTCECGCVSDVCLVSAESYFNDALAIYKLQFGPCHEKTISTQDELARLQIRAEKHEVSTILSYLYADVHVRQREKRTNNKSMIANVLS